MSDLRSLNQHWLTRNVELDFLIAFPRVDTLLAVVIDGTPASMDLGLIVFWGVLS